MFERMRGSIRRRLGEPERLGRAALGVLENDVLRDGKGASFEPLTDEQLEVCSANEVYERAADLFSALPQHIREPFAGKVDIDDLMRLSDDDLNKYAEVVRIMTAKGIDPDELLFDGNKGRLQSGELFKTLPAAE